MIIIGKLSKKQHDEIEKMLYLYAEHEKRIAILQQEINDAIPSQTSSYVALHVADSPFPNSFQESFYLRKNISDKITEMKRLKEEACILDFIIPLMPEREIIFMSMKYHRKMSKSEIADKMGLTVRWCFEIDKRILTKIYHLYYSIKKRQKKDFRKLDTV